MSAARRSTLVLASLALALPATAQAARVEVSGGVLTYTAAPGEENNPRLTAQGDSVLVTDRYTIERGPGCAPSGSDALCSGASSVVERLGDAKDDTIVYPLPVPVTVYGEAGGDRLDTRQGGGFTAAVTLEGGEGNDSLSTYDAPAQLVGGDGDDQLIGGSGADAFDGGPGNDYLIGGPGLDALDAGDGDDSINSEDGVAEDLGCGPGTDSVYSADSNDRPVPAGSCELGRFEAPPPPPPAPPPPPPEPLLPRIQVFAIQHERVRLDGSGRLPVYLRCASPDCYGNVHILAFFSQFGSGKAYRFKHAPVTKFSVKSTKNSVLRLKLSAKQRFVVRHHVVRSGTFIVESHDHKGHKYRLLTDGLYCTRHTPCGG